MAPEASELAPSSPVPRGLVTKMSCAQGGWVQGLVSSSVSNYEAPVVAQGGGHKGELHKEVGGGWGSDSASRPDKHTY